MRALDLSGEWRYETDIEDNGINERFFERALSSPATRVQTAWVKRTLRQRSFAMRL